MQQITDSETPEIQESFSLTPEEVARLLSDSKPEVRIDVLDRIALAYGQSNFSDRDKILAEQVFRLLIDDVETRVRQALAENIKHIPSVPRDIVMRMMKDVEQVTLPLLQSSMVLSDRDLIEVIQNSKQLAECLAIAKRKHVSSQVCGELIDAKFEDVVFELIKNEGSDLTDDHYFQIISDHQGKEGIIEAMVHRDSLPSIVIAKLIDMVSDALIIELDKKYDLEKMGIEMPDNIRELATLDVFESSTDEVAIERLTGHLHLYGRLKASMIFTALCRGNMLFFESSIAKLSGVPLKNARMLMNDRGGLGFKAIYDKAELPQKMYEAIHLLKDVVMEMTGENEEPGTDYYANRLVEKISAQSQGKDIENLPYIIGLIRQNT